MQQTNGDLQSAATRPIRLCTPSLSGNRQREFPESDLLTPRRTKQRQRLLHDTVNMYGAAEACHVLLEPEPRPRRSIHKAAGMSGVSVQISSE